MKRKEGRLIREIRKAVRDGRLAEPFNSADVLEAGVRCAQSTPGTFLPKHCVGNPGGNTELFVRVCEGKYRLNDAGEIGCQDRGVEGAAQIPATANREKEGESLASDGEGTTARAASEPDNVPYPIHSNGRARHALAILMRQACVRQKITYSDLAKEISPLAGKIIDRNVGSLVLEPIARTIDELNRRTSYRRRALDEVPHIEALVVLKESNGDGLPGEGFDALPDWSQMSPDERKELHSRYLQEKVYPYERWADVLDELDPTNPFRSWVRSICRRHG